jgi:hypothetical protein
VEGYTFEAPIAKVHFESLWRLRGRAVQWRAVGLVVLTRSWSAEVGAQPYENRANDDLGIYGVPRYVAIFGEIYCHLR